MFLCVGRKLCFLEFLERLFSCALLLLCFLCVERMSYVCRELGRVSLEFCLEEEGCFVMLMGVDVGFASVGG